jgi:hypothetical protein
MEIVTANELEDEPPVESDLEDEGAPEVPGSRRDAILDRIRKNADAARENRTIDLALPDNVPGDLGLRLGVPREVHGSIENDMMNLVDLGKDIRELAANVVGVSEFSGGQWQPVDGLTIEDVAVAYGTAVRGTQPAISSREQAVREVFTSGTPPQVESHALSTTARLYRRWALDPTLGLS